MEPKIKTEVLKDFEHRKEVRKMAQPEKRFKSGAITASVFANEVKRNNGTAIMKSVVLQRTYKDNDGNWQHTNSFGINDIPKAKLVLSKAFEYMTTKQES